MCRRRWADLLPEILCLILSKLHGKDVPVFRAVCRNWNSVPSPKSKHIHHVSEIVKYPFLLSYRDKSSILYTPAYNKTYSIEAPDSRLEDVRIHGSNYGWLLLSRRGRRQFFFLQPVTGDIINLPRMNIGWTWLNEMSFYAPPTSRNCVVFGIHHMSRPESSARFAFIRRGDGEWRSRHHEYPNKTRLTVYQRRLVGSKIRTNRCAIRAITCDASIEWSSTGSVPVFHNGAFYCLSKERMLGIFDPRKNRRRNMWRLLDTTMNNFLPSGYGRGNKVYMMESSRGELVSIVVGLRGEFVRMYRFDDDLELWQGLRSLEDQVAFLSPTSSIVLPCKELQVKGLENTIHFPRFDENCNVFYSLSTGKFHSFEGGYIPDDPSYNELQLNSTWIMPEFQRYSDQQLDWNNDSPEEEDGIEFNPFRRFKFLQPKNCIIDARAPKASPWIVLSHEEKSTTALVDLATNVSRSNEMFRGRIVYASTKDLVMLVESESGGGGDCVLLNTTSMTAEPLPTLKFPRNFRKTHSIIHQEGETVVITIFGRITTSKKDKAATIFCRVGNEEWTICRGGIIVCNVAAYRDKLYGMGYLPRTNRETFIEMELHQRHYKVRVIEGIELRKDRKHMGQVIQLTNFVESCGELLLFEMPLSDVADGLLPVVMDVRVSRVDLEGMRTEVVKDLGDRAFFLSFDVGFGCCASESGFERNSIYRVDGMAGNVYKYDYGSHRISVVFSTRDHDVKGCKIDQLVRFY
ncbi:F-box protein At3g56470 [Linum perenne]